MAGPAQRRYARIMPYYSIEQAESGMYHVNARGAVADWIQEQDISLWRYDDSQSPLRFLHTFVVVPRLATLLELRWG